MGAQMDSDGFRQWRRDMGLSRKMPRTGSA